jgi:hypothetical protein
LPPRAAKCAANHVTKCTQKVIGHRYPVQSYSVQK